MQIDLAGSAWTGAQLMYLTCVGPSEQRMMRTPVLVVPGWTNSGPDHWQSHWQRENPEWRRVEQADWDQPRRSAWVSALDCAVSEADVPPILVAHSLGALLVANWAAETQHAGAAGALLVAPPDIERPDTVPELLSFRPIPMSRLPFPCILVASRTDPYLDWTRASEIADAWHARLWDAGEAGHLNTASGFGPWREGKVLVEELLRMGVDG